MERINIKIRKGNKYDAKSLLNMLNSAYELAGNKDRDFYTYDWIIETIKNKKNNLVLVAEVKKEIAGFLIAESWESKRYSYLNDLYVVKSFRKKGIAYLLMNEYEKICKNKKMRNIIYLVNTKNKKMQIFSKKIGYSKGYSFYFYEKKLTE